MARQDKQVNTRVPMDLWERLQDAALANGRSVAAEVVLRLKESFDLANPDAGELIALINEPDFTDEAKLKLAQYLRDMELVQHQLAERMETFRRLESDMLERFRDAAASERRVSRKRE